MSDSEFVPYDKREEWSDLTPIPQDDGPNPLVPIAYAPDYRIASDYFRAISHKGEKSERALELTEYIINENPAHYTIWQYRQEILAALQKDLKEELDFIDDMASEHPKSYQIWHHRQIIIERLNDPSKEISFIDKMLALDSKNYHAWSYRQWVVSTYNLWDDEIPDIDRLIVEDIRNNSAWNQRFFVMSRRPQGFGEDDIVKEVSYILQKIRLAPNNESPWNYLRGILEFAGKPFDEFPQIEDVCRSFEAKAMIVPHALNFLLELNAQQVQAGQGERVAECEKISKQLEEHDPVRKLYWRHRLEQVKAFRN